jgi:nitrous oxidase accessory protein NosD
MNKRYGSILIIIVTIFVLCFVGIASASTWSVDGSGGADFTGIQDAINNASDGDTIIVHSGVYYENVYVNISLTLKGIDHPVVDARRCGKSVVTLSADGITVEGFNVTKGSWEGAGITISSSNNTAFQQQ